MQHALTCRRKCTWRSICTYAKFSWAKILWIVLNPENQENPPPHPAKSARYTVADNCSICICFHCLQDEAQGLTGQLCIKFGACKWRTLKVNIFFSGQHAGQFSLSYPDVVTAFSMHHHPGFYSKLAV